MSTLSVGVDIGTGSVKAIAISQSGEVISYDQHYYPTASGNIRETDPLMIWNTFVSLLQSFLNKLPEKPGSVTLSSCMHSLILIGQNNEPLTPMISWADNRSHEIAMNLRTSKEAKKLYEDTGTPIHAMSPLCKIIWFREYDQALYKQSSKFISIKEFIWYKLFKTYEVDYSIASATGLFNTASLHWNPDSLELAGISKQQLSDIVPPSFSRAIENNLAIDETTSMEFLNGQTFIIGSSDGCLANIGSGAIREGDIALTIGTSAAVRRTSGTSIKNFSEMTFNYVLDENTFISGGPVNNGGNIIQWLIKTFLNNQTQVTSDEYAILFDQIKEIPPGAEGLMFLPYINGERAPVWDEQATGSFVGIRSLHTHAHFLRAGVEGICFALNQLINQIDHNKTNQINVSGGFIRSTLWLQMLADITGKNLQISNNEDSSAFGAALIGLKSRGLMPDYNLSDKRPINIIKPNQANHTLYKKYYSVYVNIYPNTKSLTETLNDIYKISN